MASLLMSREYKEPYGAPSATVDPTPRAAGVADEASAAAKQAEAKPYEEAEYRRFPVVGSRVAIWAVAQLHLLFAAFVLAVPIFAFIIEAIGYKTGDLRYDRLAHEFAKLLSVSFSLTATFGACLTFMLIILYPKFTNYLMQRVLSRPSSRTSCSSSRKPSSSTPTITAGGSSIPWCILVWGSASTSSARPSC